jgi:hypothetical protein
MKTTTSLTRNSINHLLLRPGFLLTALAFACFALSPQARATCQQGCLTNENTVLGDDALFSLTTGTENTGIGFNALFSNSTGNLNTAIGSAALAQNTTGDGNTATGESALGGNTTGFFNTATGAFALQFSTTGKRNTATGAVALSSNNSGSSNTATGLAALARNESGSDNTATGRWAMLRNNTGDFNTATGVEALQSNTTGNNNTAIGKGALSNNTIGTGNVAVGFNAGGSLTTGSDNIEIGNLGVAGEANTIRIGTQGTQTATFIAGISGATVPTGVAVIVDAGGHLGTTTSSARFKEAVKPMNKASEAILALQPVTFRYKHELDPEGVPQFGLVAEEVEKVNPDLVARDADGKAYTVRYDAVNAMLLNEFLKAHKTVHDQGVTIGELKKEIAALTATIKEQAVQIQKVSAQLPASPQLVADNQ